MESPEPSPGVAKVAFGTGTPFIQGQPLVLKKSKQQHSSGSPFSVPLSRQGDGGCSLGRWCAEVYLEGMRWSFPSFMHGRLEDLLAGVLAGLRRPARLRGEGTTTVEPPAAPAANLTVTSQISCWSPSLQAGEDVYRRSAACAMAAWLPAQGRSCNFDPCGWCPIPV